MSAQLVLALITEPEPGFENHTVVSGSKCPLHDVGVLLIAGPAVAERMAHGAKYSPAERNHLIECLADAFGRAMRQAFPGTLIVTVPTPLVPPTPPMNPQRQ